MVVDHVREFFKSHDGLSYHYPTGHWWTITCREVEVTQERPAGLKYSMAFFDPNNRCLVRFDNSHAVRRKGKPNPAAYDHWHRFGENEEAVPYRFTTVEQLIEDFWIAIEKHLPPDLRTTT